MTRDRVQGVFYSRGEALASYFHLSCPGSAVASTMLRDVGLVW